MRGGNSVLLVGAGGHSVSVADSAAKAGLKVCGFIDENKTGMHLGLPIFGPDIREIPGYKDYTYHIAIGNCAVRSRWYKIIKTLGLELVNVIDPSAIVSDSVVLGAGNFIGKLAVVIAGSVIGDNNIINTKALLEHECRVGSHVNLSTNSTINGDVIVEDRVFLGSKALVNGQLRLGHDSIIGSGSVVIRDVEPFAKVAGVPAKSIGAEKEGDA